MLGSRAPSAAGGPPRTSSRMCRRGLLRSKTRAFPRRTAPGADRTQTAAAATPDTAGGPGLAGAYQLGAPCVWLCQRWGLFAHGARPRARRRASRARRPTDDRVVPFQGRPTPPCNARRPRPEGRGWPGTWPCQLAHPMAPHRPSLASSPSIPASLRRDHVPFAKRPSGATKPEEFSGAKRSAKRGAEPPSWMKGGGPAVGTAGPEGWEEKGFREVGG